VGGLSFKGVTNAHRNWHVRVFNRECGRPLLPVIIISIRLEIVQDRVRVAFCFGPRQFSANFQNFALLYLDNFVAGLLQESCAFYCGFVPIFARLVVAVNDFVTIVRETFSAPVPVVAVVLEYLLRCMVVPVHRGALNLTLATMPAHCVVNVYFPPLGFSIKPQKRSLGKRYVLDRKPSRKMSAVIAPFHPGNRSSSPLAHTFGYAVEGCKLV